MEHDWTKLGMTSYGAWDQCRRCGVDSFQLSAIGPCQPKDGA